MDKQRHHILNGDLRKLLFKFSTPAVIGLLASALYNLIDMLFVGKGVGPIAIAALTVVLPIHLIMIAVGLLVGIGSASIISRALGANQKQKALKAFGNGIILNLIANIIIIIPSIIFLDKLLTFFGASADVLPYARDYTLIILFGFIFLSFTISSNHIIRSEGKPRAAMYPMIIGAVLNIFLDPIFIFILNLGVRGAAIATVISQIISSIYVIIYILSRKSIFKLNFRILKPQYSILKEILSIGLPSFLMQIIASIITLIFNRSILHYGNDLYIAVMGISLRIINLIQLPIIGITQGFSTIVSFNYGARQYTRIKEVLKEAFILTLTVAGIGFIVMMFFPGLLLSAFTNDRGLIQMGIMPLRIVVIFLPLIGFQILSGTLFQAIGKSIPALVIILSRQLLLLIPMIIILPLFFGLDGIWLSIPVSDFLSLLIGGIFIYRQIDSFNKYSLKAKTNIT